MKTYKYNIIEMARGLVRLVKYEASLIPDEQSDFREKILATKQILVHFGFDVAVAHLAYAVDLNPFDVLSRIENRISIGQ